MSLTVSTKEPRSRNWCFTLNNPPHGWTPPENIYCVVGKEVAPTTGTKHLQGYIRFKDAKTKSAVIKLLPGAHVTLARGTVEQNYNYCVKELDWVEYGVKPSFDEHPGAEATKRMWSEVTQLARADDMDKLAEDYPRVFIAHYRTLKLIAKDYQVSPSDLQDTCGVWLYGVAGAGKSWKARRDYPGYYLKSCNKWWDSYQNEVNVIIDDFDKSHDCLGHHLKLWADRYAFPAEMKGSSKQIRPEKIIVTSQYKIEDIWVDDETRAALNRRFVVERVGEAPLFPLFIKI